MIKSSIPSQSIRLLMCYNLTVSVVSIILSNIPRLVLILLSSFAWPLRSYLPVTSVIWTSTELELVCSNMIKSILFELIKLMSNCLGISMLDIPLSSIITTDGISGLTDAALWTHNIATCMHLNASSLQHESTIKGSISSTALLSFHKLHA